MDTMDMHLGPLAHVPGDEPEQEASPPMDPAIAALLRDRQRINDGLRTLGYVEPEAPVEVDLPDGFYPLHDFGKAPSIDTDAVEAAKERLREANIADLTPKVQTLGEEMRDALTAAGQPPPVTDSDDEAIIRDAWKSSTVNDREIMVGLKSIGSGNVDAITKGTNAIFNRGMQPWTARRSVYGSKTHAPQAGTLIARGLVEQTDPMARGRIKYRLTDLGRKAVDYGAAQGKQTP